MKDANFSLARRLIGSRQGVYQLEMNVVGTRRAPTVLVAEDIIDLRVLMRVLLEGRGCRVVEAANGAQAIWKALEEKPDLILMDLSMPVLDGLDATREIRRRPEMNGVPVVAVTAHCDTEWRRKAFEAGCVECVEKPLDLGKIDALLSRFGKDRIDESDAVATFRQEYASGNDILAFSTPANTT